MSCRNVETIITELARGQMLEARVKEDALAHLEGCQRCAARYADEQALTNGLLAVTASVASVETPLRVEVALLSAFRQGAMTPRVSALPPARTLETPWLPWSIAAAAAILIFSVFALPHLLPSDSRELAGNKATEAQTMPSQSPVSSPGEVTGAQTSSGLPDDDTAGSPEQEAINVVSSPRQGAGRRALMQNAGLRNRAVRGATEIQPALSANEEITTEFLPITYGSNLSQLDDGQVVRVELPRSALQSFGLPLNAERAGERVKADVLLGHDGVARAIRFVR